GWWGGCPSRGLEGEVDALLSRDASDEEEIVTGAPADRRRREVDAVVDRREPVCIRVPAPLAIADRDERDRRHRLDVLRRTGDVEAAVERGHDRNRRMLREQGPLR